MATKYTHIYKFNSAWNKFLTAYIFYMQNMSKYKREFWKENIAIKITIRIKMWGWDVDQW
jgi:hypothetical protein